MAKGQPYSPRYYQANKDRLLEANKEWRDQNSAYVKTYMKGRREGMIGAFSPSDGPDWQARNREAFLATKRENTNRRRREVFFEALQTYGGQNPSCYCCGENVVMLLGLDHIDGGGNKHRKEIGGHVHVWAKRHGWPRIFRVACHSCNLGTYLNGGVCPHNTQLSPAEKGG